jgi:amidohydrolase|uniref:Amidohydrolase n=1 Tax=Desulfobacca acetoxidans TaxID=60893 RepID=A0A7C3SIL5_9BACT
MDLLKEIKARAEGLAGELSALRRDFHQHPELSHHEERTARVVAKYLESLGLAVQTGVAGHGVVGRLLGARPGKVVAWRADMDALPVQEKVASPWRSKVEGVMHACGHDFHLSIALGAARLLSELKEHLAGEYRFIFQPAEEGPPLGDTSGAQGMVQAGVLEAPPVTAICGLHVAPTLEVGQIRYCPEVVMAGSDHLILTVTGKSVHGATPHRGIDPILVSAELVIQIKATLTQEIDARSPVVLTFGKIEGGNRFNILADRVELEGSLRYLQESVREKVLTILRRHLAGLAKATGARIELATQSIYPILRNDPRLSERAVDILRQVLGAKRVKLHLPAMGSEDFAYFAQRVPAFYFFLGVRTPGSKGQALHSPEFNPDEAALPIGLQAAAALLARLAGSD